MVVRVVRVVGALRMVRVVRPTSYPNHRPNQRPRVSGSGKARIPRSRLHPTATVHHRVGTSGPCNTKEDDKVVAVIRLFLVRRNRQTCSR